jgi:hypothetical protein
MIGEVKWPASFDEAGHRLCAVHDWQLGVVIALHNLI